MGLRAGIIGLPNVGKSTLFNAITKKNILAANYPFATIDPNIGMVTVPDERLAILEEMYLPNNTIATSFEFIDIAGLVKGASKGEGLGNKFLSHIREVDAICQVVRCFEDNNVIHVENNINPIRDIEIINVELTISDLEIIEGRLSRIQKKAETNKDKEALIELAILNKAKENLIKGIPLRLVDFSKDELLLLKSFSLITLKPMIYLANVKEEEKLKDNMYVNMVEGYSESEGSKTIKICAKFESELSEFNDEDKYEMLKMAGIDESSLDKLIKVTYDLLGLATYFTVGKDEVRAWTFKKGMNAKECAGIIHTDFERGFIRAEVMSYEDLINCGNELKVRESGKARLEGKDYVMKDGDICHFRFNV